MLLEDAEQVTTGALFGAALTASGMFAPSIILEQFELKNFYMVQVFAVAMGSSALIMFAFDRLGLVQRPVRPNSPLGAQWVYGGNLLGGILVGLGMNLTGACPGTVLVQLAQGVPSAWPAACGALLGGVAYRYVSPTLLPHIRPQSEQPVKTTIPQAAHLPDTTIYALLGASILGLLAITHSWLHVSGPWSGVGGLAIGAAQAVSLLLTSGPIGVSTAYEDAGRYILQTLHVDETPKPSKVPKAMVFAAAMVAGSVAFSQNAISSSISPAVYIPFWQALIGGFIMVFGARIGGGCTSGHGLSGMAALSVSSLVTVVGMFGTAILSRLLMTPSRQ